MKKHYYEIWFYFYGEEDSRTDLDKEYTFYIKTDKEIKTKDEMISHLREKFPVCERFNMESINCVPERDYNHLSNWFEISGDEFTEGCGISA